MLRHWNKRGLNNLLKHYKDEGNIEESISYKVELGVAPEKIWTTNVILEAMKNHHDNTKIVFFPHYLCSFEVSIWQHPRSCGWRPFHSHDCHMALRWSLQGEYETSMLLLQLLIFWERTSMPLINASCENLLIHCIDECL